MHNKGYMLLVNVPVHEHSLPFAAEPSLHFSLVLTAALAQASEAVLEYRPGPNESSSTVLHSSMRSCPRCPFCMHVVV